MQPNIQYPVQYTTPPYISFHIKDVQGGVVY